MYQKSAKNPRTLQAMCNVSDKWKKILSALMLLPADIQGYPGVWHINM